jgi:hypothetical protein
VPRRSCRAWPTATSCCRTPSATTWPPCSTSRSPDRPPRVPGRRSRRRERFRPATSTKGTRSPDTFHRELGKIIWDYCGMERTEQGLEKALSEIPALYEEFRKDLRVTGTASRRQPDPREGRPGRRLLRARQLMCRDALTREESCGGHFRSRAPGPTRAKAKRDDENFAHVGAWEWTGDADAHPNRHVEPAHLRHRPPRRPELQVSKELNLTLKVWRQDGPDAPGTSRPTRTGHQRRGCRSSRCSTASTSAHRRTARGHRRSTTTAVKASAAPAR